MSDLGSDARTEEGGVLSATALGGEGVVDEG